MDHFSVTELREGADSVTAASTGCRENRDAAIGFRYLGLMARVVTEILTSIKRAGADLVITCHGVDFAERYVNQFLSC